jgi:hypothetical protein
VNNYDRRGDFTFIWKDDGSSNKLELHNRTLNEALEIARDMGWRDHVWWNPKTWSNVYCAWFNDKRGL